MIEAKICSVIRGMIPFISRSSMFGPYRGEQAFSEEAPHENPKVEVLTIIVWDFPEPV